MHDRLSLVNTLAKLKELVRFPGVSAHGFDHRALEESAAWLERECLRAGFDAVEVIRRPQAAPYLLAKAFSGFSHAKKVLVYAHYDVQPIGNERIWLSSPFEPTERGGRLYGRGTADDKAGVVATIEAIRAFRAKGQPLPVDVIFLLDGEEECGSPHMEDFLRDYRTDLQADYLIVPDLVNPKVDTGSLTFSLRGLIEFNLTLTGLATPIHSGLGGGVLPDVTQALAKLYGGALGKNGEVLIPGVRTDKSEKGVLPATLPPKNMFPLLPRGAFLYKSAAQFYRALWFSPALTLLQIQIAEPENYANRIQQKVEAVFSLRLAPQQDPKKVVQALKRYFVQKVPYGCRAEMEVTHEAKGFFTHPQQEYFQKALKAVTQAYGKKAIGIGSGLTIPLVSLIQKELSPMRTILLGVEDPQSNAHAENESVDMAMFHKTILALTNLFQTLS